MNHVDGVRIAWLVADDQPSLRVSTGLAAVDDDRVVVGCAGQGHLKFVHRRVVAGDYWHGQLPRR